MFWGIIGLGVFCYGLFYTVMLIFVDSDLELAFYERFGKSIGRLKGKVVFITGASSGIGEHTAIALARHGVKLVLTARRRNELERVKAACLEASKGALSQADVLVLAFDLCDLDQHKRQFDHAVRYFGSVDILFNNAGRSQRALWENIDISVDRQAFDLNVFSVVNLSRVALNHFNHKGYGHIAVTSSLAGVIGVPFSGSYTGAKHAIHGFMNSLRIEKMGKHISVTLLCPGPTFTNFLQESFTERPGELNVPGTSNNREQTRTLNARAEIAIDISVRRNGVETYRHSSKYGITTQPTDKRMTAERCGELCAIALANKTRESWMAVFPLMPLTYTAVYFPIIFHIALRILGPEKLFKFRDSRDTTVLQEHWSRSKRCWLEFNNHINAAHSIYYNQITRGFRLWLFKKTVDKVVAFLKF